MNLPDLKQLDKIIALCRKRGVLSIEIDNVKLTLNETVPESNYKKLKEKKKETPIDTKPYESDYPKEEDLLFWSVGAFDNEKSGDNK